MKTREEIIRDAVLAQMKLSFKAEKAKNSRPYFAFHDLTRIMQEAMSKASKGVAGTVDQEFNQLVDKSVQGYKAPIEKLFNETDMSGKKLGEARVLQILEALLPALKETYATANVIQQQITSLDPATYDSYVGLIARESESTKPMPQNEVAEQVGVAFRFGVAQQVGGVVKHGLEQAWFFRDVAKLLAAVQKVAAAEILANPNLQAADVLDILRRKEDGTQLDKLGIRTAAEVEAANTEFQAVRDGKKKGIDPSVWAAAPAQAEAITRVKGTKSDPTDMVSKAKQANPVTPHKSGLFSRLFKPAQEKQVNQVNNVKFVDNKLNNSQDDLRGENPLFDSKDPPLKGPGRPGSGPQ